jgi:hypothetical protein
MVHYANLTGDPDAVPAQNAIDLFRLMDRQRDRWPLSFGLRLIGQSIRNFFKHLFQLPRPLVASAEHCSDDAAPFDLVVHEFSTDDTATLRRLAKEKRVSLNAWLLCDLFRTIAIWNHAQDDRPSSNPWYRLCMPISLRERADAATPATNLVGLTFLQRRRTSLVGDRDQLLHSLEQECSDIKRLRRGTLFLRNLRLVCTVPGVLRLLLRLPVCYATMTLTNLGDPGRRLQSQFRRQDGKLLFGNLSIASFGGAPPLTGYLHGTISVNTYRDRLTLNLYMSPQRFTRADAARFMDIYVGELRAAVKPEQAASLQPLASPG